MPAITHDVFKSRGHARAAARLLHEAGWDAKVEQSGPAGQREWRVVVRKDGRTAYFQEGTRFDQFDPVWVQPATDLSPVPVSELHPAQQKTAQRHGFTVYRRSDGYYCIEHADFIISAAETLPQALRKAVAYVGRH